MNYKEKLIELLKTQDEVKNEMEKHKNYVVSTVWKKKHYLILRL